MQFTMQFALSELLRLRARTDPAVKGRTRRYAGSTIVAAVRPEPHLDRLQSSRRPSATYHGAARTTFE